MLSSMYTTMITRGTHLYRITSNAKYEMTKEIKNLIAEIQDTISNAGELEAAAGRGLDYCLLAVSQSHVIEIIMPQGTYEGVSYKPHYDSKSDKWIMRFSW